MATFLDSAHSVARPGFNRWLVPPVVSQKLITTNNVLLEQAIKTPQFYLLWFVLFLNVTAGIGVLGQASLMIQEMFGVTAVAAAGFVGLMSIFNMGGRIFWASMPDFMGRKTTYVIFFVLAQFCTSSCLRLDTLTASYSSCWHS